MAFSHSLHLLLRPTTEYSYDQPSYTDDENNPWNLVSTYQSISSDGTIGSPSLIAKPDENTNLFSMFDTAILAVYFMLTGDRSAVSPWILKKNWTLALLLVVFSFFTTIYLLNLLIGLLNMAIDNTNNEESFLRLRGEILAEIEILWMFPYQRRKKNWFPEILYYEASINELKKYIKKVENENYEEISRPHLSSAIQKIAEYHKDDTDKKITDIGDEVKKNFNEMKENFNEIIKLIKSEKKKEED